MSGLRDFLRWNTAVTPLTPTRASIAPLELREAHAALHVTHTVGKPQWPRKTPDAYQRDAYMKLALIFRCTNLIASAVAEAPVRVYRERDGDTETLPDHPLRQLLTRPNPQMGEAALFYNLVVRMCIYGFAAFEIERSGAGRPVGVWPLRSDWMKPIPRDQESYDWEYTVPGRQPVVLLGDDLVIVPYASLGDGDPRGIGPLEVAFREVGLLNTMQDHLKGFFDGGGLPVYGLIPDTEVDMTRDDANLVRDMWVEATTWRGGTPPKPPIMKSIKGIERLSFDYNELAYVDLRDVSEIAILTAFGVPGSLVGQRFAQERNTFSNYAEARTSFYQDTIQKLWSRIDDALTRSLLPELDVRGDVHLEFDVSKIDALQEDQTERRAHLLEAVKAGAVTRAEYKQALGLPVDPADEVYLMPFSVIEVPVGQAMPPRLPALPPPSDDERALPSGMERRNKLPIERRDAIQRRSNRVYDQTARLWAPRIDTYLQSQKQRVLATIVGAQRSMEVREALNVDDLDWDFELDELNDILGKLWNQVGEQAMADVDTLIPLPTDSVSLGDPFDLANQWVDTVRDDIGSRVVGITDTTKADIQRVVNEALAEGTSPDDLADRLTGLYEETYSGRSRAIARTESQVAFNTASANGYAQRGVTEVELMDNPLHTTDPGSDGLTCAQRNGRIVPVGSVNRHIWAEHVNGTLAIAPVLANW